MGQKAVLADKDGNQIYPVASNVLIQPASFTDFVDVAKEIASYPGQWTNDSKTIVNSPFASGNYTFEVIPEGTTLSGTIIARSQDGVIKVAGVSAGILGQWKEPVTTDFLKKQITASTTISSTLEVDFVENAIGVSASFKGNASQLSTAWGWTAIGKLPDTISKPVNAAYIHSIGETGISGVSTRIPTLFTLAINPDGTIMYRFDNLDSNNWDIHKYDVDLAGSVFYFI